MANLNPNNDNSDAALRYIVHNVFLPPKVPDEKESDIPMMDCELIMQVLNVANMFKTTLGEGPLLAAESMRAWEIVCRMLKTMHAVRPEGTMTKSSLEEGLHSMKVGDVLPIYVSGQNAGIIFRKRSDKELSFECFEVSLQNEVVMGTIGKVAVQYPANPRIYITSNEKLLSTLADAISFFGSQHLGEVFPVIIKARAGHENVRDTVSPRYITEALAGFLRGVSSVGDSSKEHQTIFIEKRIDDRVVFGSGKEGPWRRSSMWLLLRVSLQTTLEELGMTGGAGYKAFQACLMAHLLQRCNANLDLFPDDILDAMNRKLARRMWKLKEFVDSGTSITLSFASSVISQVGIALRGRWDEVRRQCVNTINWTTPTQPAIQASLGLSLQTNHKYLKSVVERTRKLDRAANQYDDSKTTRGLISACSTRLDVHAPQLPSSINTNELDISLMDFESWVENHLPKWSQSSIRSPERDCVPLSSILEAYAQQGFGHYAKTPERFSVFWLTMVELWVALDKLVIRWNKLLSEYPPEIPHDLLDPLLLPFASQLKRLEIVQSHIRQRQDGARRILSLFGEIHSEDSFQNIYFTKSQKLQEEKRKIEKWGSEEKEKTLQKMKIANKKYESLMAESRELQCEQYTYITRSGYERQGHSNSCRKCALNSEASRMRVSKFEEPLPSEPLRANALVFELNCPTPFGVWREVTYQLLLRAFSYSGGSKPTVYRLKDFVPTNQFYHSKERRLSIDSSAAAIANSFHGNSCPLPATTEQVIFPHGGRYSLSYDGKWLQKRGECVLRPFCTLPLDKPYESLAHFMANTAHSPNSVIASQAECPLSINLGEYLAFGHLRSGNEIQLRNVKRTVISNSLSLNEPGVHSLLMQAIWQAGPNEINKMWYRDAHQDLSDKKFAEDMLVVLNESLQKVGESGREILYLATLTALATRLLSLTEDTEARKECLWFLQKAREKASDWMELAETEAAANTSNDSGRVHHKMALIAVVLRLTFDVDANVLEILCNSPTNITILLFAKMVIAADSTQTDSLSFGTRLLLRRDRNLAYRLEPYIFSALGRNSEPLHKATHRIWGGYHRGSQWTALSSNGSRWWKCATSRTAQLESRTVCVNILSGDMLVDGKTPERLPSSYIAHATYKYLFDKSVALRSRPSTMRGMEYEATYKGIQLHFAMIGESLVVRLLRDGTIEEFIPQDKLREDVSSFFLHEQLHWYIEEGERRFIEFRPLKEGWSSDLHKNWAIHLNESVATGLRGTLRRNSSLGLQSAMDPHSPVFKTLHRAVKGVEPLPLSIYVLASANNDPQSTLLNITLPNRDLDFFVNQDGHLESRSFPHYILDNSQDILSLYGLVDCLVLCDSSPSQRFRKVVIPRGRIEAVKSPRRHPTIRVRAAEKPGFQVYDVDNLVGRLVGNGTMESDLFLIQLHAYTASHCPDPLTNRTGTEEALESLESCSLLSHYVPSASWREQLNQIAAISPRRAYYPHWEKAMEQVGWNSNLPIASQHPGFETRIASILSYWADIDASKDHQDHARPLKPASGMVELSRRAAMRDLRTTTSHSALKKHDQDDRNRKHILRDVLQCPESRKREALAYQVAFCAHHHSAGLPVCKTLEQEAKKWSQIEPNGTWDWSDFPEWFNGSIPSLWSTLYELSYLASRDQEDRRFDIAMTLTIIGYRETIPLNILGTLVAIIRDPEFQEYDYNLSHGLQMNLGSEFKDSEIRSWVEPMQIGFTNSEESDLTDAPGVDHNDRLQRRHNIYNAAVSQEVNQVVDTIKQWWLDTHNHGSAITVPHKPHLQQLDVLIRDTIRPRLEIWLQNKRFLEHLATVDRRILQASHPVSQPVQYQPGPALLRRSGNDIKDLGIERLLQERNPKHTEVGAPRMPAFSIHQPTSVHDLRVVKINSLLDNLGNVLHGRIENQYKADLMRSIQAFSTSVSITEAQIPTKSALFAFRNIEEQFYDTMRTEIAHVLAPALPAEILLAAAGLWPGVTSRTLLSRLSLQLRTHTPKNWITAISVYADQIIAVQRSRRLLHYGTRGMVTEFNREILHGRQREALGHPDTLLVEIDADICIRSDQMNIAEAMIDPSEGKNTVMQLNMGEGKSSVIVPVVAAALANTEQLVRVVVLKPQSKLQLSLLRGRLSRLANRRIICLPFSRDLKVDMATAQKISRILEACRIEGAIWLCQPEHVLSFKLLGLDLAMRKPDSLSIGAELIKCQLWMQENTRDILDESDEILHTRHQLVYTVGSQANFDAAPARWEVVQQLLALMHSHLSAQPSPHFLVGASSSPGQFPSIRMMFDEGNELFHELATKIVYRAAIPSIRMANLPTQLKNAAMILLTQCKIPPLDPEVRSLELYCQENDEQSMWHSLLIVRGLIAFSILPLALQNKRWRVDYGHDLRRSQLAVPYRAKDSPSLRSDFAHPDVLVLLTCLTYYYSGLDDAMIVRTVKELLKLDNPDLVYEQWIAPCRDQVPVALHKFAGVNVDDDKMIVQSLRPFIGQNKLAIDFFLNRCVFPKEAKEFPYKMSTSGWDLAMQKANPTTGFSGTNDSRFLLPTSIVQADSSAQRHTNATVLAHILQDENGNVVPHANNLTSEQILDTIFALNPQPTVLLDVGAQILDCSNEDLVKLWLSMYEEGGPIKAAVFFDDDDNMCIMEYDGAIQGFADSPYSTRLNECLVYLDDSHTRGTDLKLPACRAAVTLGPRLPKDKLVQGCMRMRKLGSQHSLVFLAPAEVIGEIKKTIGDENAAVESSHVLLWAMKETCRQLQVNVANWAMQGYEFAARQSGWRQMSMGVRTAQQMQELFCQQESRSLDQLYGIGKRKSARERASHTLSLSSSAQNPMLRAIEEHCKLFESFSFDDARTQEEQEVELIHEQEVERQVERPPSATPAPHSVHPHVKQFASTGVLVPNSPAFRTVQRSLEHTSLIFPAGGTSAFSNLIVTEDFYRTILGVAVGSTKRIDDFLRPVEWVVTSQAERRPLLVALSPYEVNQLLSTFRTSKKSKLHLFSPRTSLGMRSLEDLQLFTLPTNLPTTPLPSPLAQQLNLYSGTLYLRDLQSYCDVCAVLRLHFGDLDSEIADLGVINSNGFVKDRRAREELGIVGQGFEEDPVQFFRKLFHLRRNGRSFLPSHMGQILFGVGLTDGSFEV